MLEIHVRLYRDGADRSLLAVYRDTARISEADAEFYLKRLADNPAILRTERIPDGIVTVDEWIGWPEFSGPPHRWVEGGIVTPE